MSDASHHSILALPTMDAASTVEIAAIAAAVRAALETPTADRARLIESAGSQLMALPEDCLEPERIDGLLEIGQLAYFEGRSVEGLSLVKAAAGLAARAGDVALQRKALTYEAALHSDLGDVPTSIESTAGAIIQARELGETSGEAALWGNLGVMLSQVGDWRGGLRASERALELDPSSGSALVNAAEACLELGNVVKGLRHARKCIESDRGRNKLQQLAVRAEAEAICGRILLEVDDVQRAADHAAAARTAAAQMEAPRALPPVLALEGMCAALRGDRAAGLRLLRAARDMRTPDRSIDHQQRQALRWTARLHRMLGDDEAARELLNEQTETMTEATVDHLRMAAALPGSSAFPLVSELAASSYSKSGSVYERFAAVAVSIEEGSGEHGYRVGDLAAMLATDYGCDEIEVAAAAQAGRLHDIGKLCVPPAVLVKEDPLDEFEATIFCEHPLHGATVLAGAALPHAVLDGVRHHHERWDGHGFPFRLAGEAIPLTARIVGIAEAFDEMIHSRARKREPWTVRRALEELLRQRGKRFDPRLVDLLIERVRDLQREFGGVDEALSGTADRSTLVIARRRLREMLASPFRADAT